MRKLHVVITVVGLLCLLGVPAFGAPITLYNTGAGAASPGVQDPNWTVQLGPNAYEVTGSPSSFPFSNWWLANDGTSQWIAPQPTYTLSGPVDIVGNWDFRTTFTLSPQMVPSTAQISGRWITDNQGIDVYLNGLILTPHLTTPLNAFSTWSLFAIPAGSPFQSGLNTLDFIVVNAAGTGGNPVGLRVEMTGSASLVPEPATYALLAAGLLGLGVLYRRKKRA